MSTFLVTVVLLSLAPQPAASTEAEAEPFRPARAGWRFQFPRDHGSHPEFQTEWWYFTGHLTAASGRRYGFELTFFRVGVDPADPPAQTRWGLRHLALAHFALTDLDRREFRFYEKLNRLSPFTADAAEGELDVFNEGWSARAQEDGSWRIRADADGDAIDLVLRAAKPPAIHGIDGVSVKGAAEGAASHYYSMPRLLAEGSIAARGRSESCRGQAWMDHEFSTSFLGQDQAGWDWFSLQFDDGTELMLYQMRLDDGSIDPHSSGSFIETDGSVRPLTRGEFAIDPVGRWRSPRSDATYPMGWDIAVPSLGIRARVDPELRDQELVTTSSTGVTYWEGAVRASGSRHGNPLDGLGYVEMTGYAAPFRMGPN